MKALDKFKVLFVAFFITTGTASSQKDNPLLNQAELLKKFEGSWTCEIGKDTIAQWDMIAYGAGFDAKLKYVTGGRIVKEGKGSTGMINFLIKLLKPV